MRRNLLRAGSHLVHRRPELIFRDVPFAAPPSPRERSPSSDRKDLDSHVITELARRAALDTLESAFGGKAGR
jgi:hypothetical protein